MELTEAVTRRRMRRAFAPDPVAPELVTALLDGARRAPSAGNAQGTTFVVLEGSEQTARYWDVTLPEERRQGFRWPGLLAAPVLVIVVASPTAYVTRYAEADKARTGLGEHADRWATPYWYVDAGMVVQNLLLSIEEAGLGACFFGMFDHASAVFRALGVPAGQVAIGTVALGYPLHDSPGRSRSRPRRALDDVIRRGAWGPGT